MFRVTCTVILLVATTAAFAQPAADGPVLPGIRVDREAGVVDLDATVVNREPDWLELLACTPGSLDHEAILAVNARPSHIHLALLLLGLKPGHPSRPVEQDGRTVLAPPTGPELRLSLIFEREGQTVEVPANSWIKLRETGERLEDDRWLFAGSIQMDWQGEHHYLADESGTAITLVNFNDDLLARPTDVTRDNDQRQWVADTDAIPPLDTPVTIRLRPVAEDAE